MTRWRPVAAATWTGLLVLATVFFILNVAGVIGAVTVNSFATRCL